jgi:hypothetical protein
LLQGKCGGLSQNFSGWVQNLVILKFSAVWTAVAISFASRPSGLVSMSRMIARALVIEDASLGLLSAS